MAVSGTVESTDIAELTLVNRGKVRDIYRVDEDRLLIVATDRISAFDCVMPNQIPSKGRVLTQISDFWFEKLSSIVRNHKISIRAEDMPKPVNARPELHGRAMLVTLAKVFPVECVVRGYLEGSGWKDYSATGTVCGHSLPANLRQCERLEEPLFTPATKAASGHDENIDFARFTEIVGSEKAALLKDYSLELYRAASEHAETRGIIIADTKFEFGADPDGNIILVDEVLTPDSSRFWDARRYEPGHAQPSFDKQFVREYLESLDWDKTPPAPPLPDEIVAATRKRYLEAFRRLTGTELAE